MLDPRRCAFCAGPAKEERTRKELTKSEPWAHNSKDHRSVSSWFDLGHSFLTWTSKSLSSPFFKKDGKSRCHVEWSAGARATC